MKSSPSARKAPYLDVRFHWTTTDRAGLTMCCCSGRHEWDDPVSASRCCHPDWSRELRFGLSDRVPGDAGDGVRFISGGWCWV